MDVVLIIGIHHRPRGAFPVLLNGEALKTMGRRFLG
jgi:hypothetical protein